MTLDKFRRILKVLLIGDNDQPKGDEDLIAILEMAYMEIADISTPLKWLTKSTDVNIMRQGPGGYFVRMPELPQYGTDILDIDSELVPSIARVVASYIAKEVPTKAYHMSLATKALSKYDSKVRAYILNEELKGKYVIAEEIPDSGDVYE